MENGPFDFIHYYLYDDLYVLLKMVRNYLLSSDAEEISPY